MRRPREVRSLSRASIESMATEPAGVEARQPDATPAVRHTGPARRRGWRIIRRAGAALLLGVFLSWAVAAVLCWTIEPRRGTVRTSESWQVTGTSVSAQLWDGPASRYAEVVRMRG